MRKPLSVFGRVWDASGVRNFDGNAWWYHSFMPGLDFSGATFVAKTTTIDPRKGNMPLKKDGITPRDLFPSCIKVYPRKGIALNAVGLSGPGAEALLKAGMWQRMTAPFFLSFMSVEATPELRVKELERFVHLLRPALKDFQAPVGLQINFSCPNVGLQKQDERTWLWEKEKMLTVAEPLDIPLVPKVSVTTPCRLVRKLADHPACSGICVSNTIPWGHECINWRELFGTDISPLQQYGGGGLSGKPLLPLVREWVISAREAGIQKPINAGGGILSLRDAESLFTMGADSVFLGSIAFLRGWRVRGIIQAIQKKGEKKDV